jgi:hypothetical protein
VFPQTWVLAPHPDEEYVAGKVADTFRPGEQGQITLEDGTVSAFSIGTDT